MLIGSGLTIALVCWIDDSHVKKGSKMNDKTWLAFWLFLAVMSLWGIIWGILNGPL